MRVIGIAMAGNLLNYVWMVSYPNQVHRTTGMSIRDTLLAGVISVGVSLVLLPFAGRLADRVGRRPVLIAFAIASILWAWPSFGLLHAGISLMEVTLIQTVSMVIMTGFGGDHGRTIPGRSSGDGHRPYALSVTLFGGTALYLMAAMAGWGYGGMFWIYLVVISATSEVVYVRMPETRG